MNDTRQTPMSFKLAVIATLSMPLACLVYAIGTREWGMFAGALMWLLIYASLGYFALKGSEWARWILVTLMLGSAILLLVTPVSRVRRGGSSVLLEWSRATTNEEVDRDISGDPSRAVIFPLFYGLVALRLALGRRRLAS